MNPKQKTDSRKPASAAPQSSVSAERKATLPFLNDDGSKKRCTWLEQLSK